MDQIRAGAPRQSLSYYGLSWFFFINNGVSWKSFFIDIHFSCFVYYTPRSLIRRAWDREHFFIRRRKGNPLIPFHYTIYYHITRDETQRLQRVWSLLPERGEGCVHTHWIHCILFRVMHIIFYSNSFGNLIWWKCRAKEWEWRGTTFPSYKGARSVHQNHILRVSTSSAKQMSKDP